MMVPPVSAPPAFPLAVDAQQVDVINPQNPLVVRRLTQGRVPVVLIEGGIAGTRRAAQRCGVQQFVAESGAQAGLNGTFFSDAALRGTDNHLIGPTLCGGELAATLDRGGRQTLQAGRPLVLLSPTRTRIVSYDPATMDSDTALRQLLPGVTDAFLGGAWLVHEGVGATTTQLDQYHVKDAEDFRRRAFFVLERDGRPGLGATTDVTSSTRLADTLTAAGIGEAVLLDSGFSTSLVLGHKILVTGHTAPGLASRPVPHAVMLFAPARAAHQAV